MLKAGAQGAQVRYAELFDQVAYVSLGSCRRDGTTLSAPGSYVVTANLTATSSSIPCIHVTASRVTIELGGFTLTGIGGSPGIAASAGPLIVADGIIKSFKVGVSTAVSGVTLRSVTLQSNTGNGAALGDNAEITDSEFRGNSGNGLIVGNNALISNCTFTGNSGSGVLAGSGAVIIDNAASNNTSNVGFETQGNSTLTGNAANSNVGYGFFDTAGSAFEGNTAATATDFDGFGSETSDIGVFIGNSTLGNKRRGFSVEGTLLANTANNNGLDGFASNPDSTFITNTADGNGGFASLSFARQTLWGTPPRTIVPARSAATAPAAVTCKSTSVSEVSEMAPEGAVCCCHSRPERIYCALHSAPPGHSLGSRQSRGTATRQHSRLDGGFRANRVKDTSPG